MECMVRVLRMGMLLRTLLMRPLATSMISESMFRAVSSLLHFPPPPCRLPLRSPSPVSAVSRSRASHSTISPASSKLARNTAIPNLNLTLSTDRVTVRHSVLVEVI